MIEKKNVFIGVGTKNEVKIKAVEAALSALSVFTRQVIIKSIKVDFLLNQPFDHEVKEGAMFRARFGLEHARRYLEINDMHYDSTQDFLLGVGIEGGIVSFHSVYYITAYCHALDAQGEDHGSWTGFLECPPDIFDTISSGKPELGEVISKLRDLRQWPWHGGAFGTLTGGHYTRLDALRDAMILCISPFFIK